ncbi:MAG: mechanosensitive ion channel protein MscS [endosymbiont of Galathealinum brachiosum]|uniref:Mechanosensitive ion channel protein MscS n=1 Tax=endosymbiont of Galathealinum brachiosum TaxID=2200906 RepID=A0A370DIK2_9GAMM|nr:MAG: mechanosensitive ion channel protein MscS [endosymbiont of Galathealinum brachiosum]
MEYIQQLLSQLNIDKDSIWISQVFIIVFVTLIISFFQKRIFNQLHNKLTSTKNPWDDLLIGAAGRPLSYLIWLLGILFAAEIVKNQNDALIFSAIDPIRDVGVVSILVFFILQIIKGTEAILIQNQQKSGEHDFDTHTVQAIGKLVRISVFITGGLIMLQTLGYSISGILAFGGVGGIAIGFAAKDLLANFFGGLMIYLDRPFKVGDWIRSDDKSIEGTVENIGWRLTRIRTFDKRPLYVPNSIFNNISVENPSRMTNRRIKETMGIRYDDVSKMAVIIEQVKTMLKNHPDIDNEQTLIVNFNSFAASSLDFFIYTFTKTTDWIQFHEIKQDVLLKIVEIIEKNGAEFAFPTSTLHLQTMQPIGAPENGR